jgi:excisionase family DNA binding protein
MGKLPEKELLRPDEVAKYFSLALSTIYTWIDTGKLEAVKLAGKTIRIKREVVIELQKSTLN